MSEIYATYIAILIVLILIFVDVPISFSFLFASIAYFILSGEILDSIPPATFRAFQNPALIALPLFLIAGNLMEESGIADQLVNFSERLLKKVKGGFGSIIPLATMFFGALCGSGTAAMAALGSILLPKLDKRGWDRRYTAAFLAASEPLGYMIPPNINAILYAYITDTSVAALFLATTIPGIIWGIIYIIINRVVYKKYNPKVVEDSEIMSSIEEENIKNISLERQNLYSDLKGVTPAIIMAIIVLGGIYGGIFTATEAGAVSCIYTLIVGFLVYKKLNFKNSYDSFKKAALLIGSFMIVFPFTTVFSRILVMNGIPQAITVGIISLTDNKNIILLLIDIIYIIAGIFLPPGVLVLVITPLLIPVAQLIGLSTIQLGVMLMIAIGIGCITPPMAMNLFVVSDISGIKIHEMIKPIIVFLVFAEIPMLLLVTYYPDFSLWLPKVILGMSY